MNVIMAALWGIVILGTVIVEILTVQFVSIWFSCASLISLILAVFGAPVWVQLVVFLAVTALLLILTRPLVGKLRVQAVRTNADMNIGMTAVVTEDIQNELSKGRATVGGVSWKAVSEDGAPIPAGEPVEIRDIDGAKLIVKKV